MYASLRLTGLLPLSGFSAFSKYDTTNQYQDIGSNSSVDLGPDWHTPPQRIHPHVNYNLA